MFRLTVVSTVALQTLGHIESESDCFESQQTTLLQHGFHVAASEQQVAATDAAALSSFMMHHSPVIPSLDGNGRVCMLCSLPPAERAPNQSYVQRSDCGNHSLFENPAMLQVPLSSLRRQATKGQNETFGWCELNVEKGCADAIYNEDYMMFAKSVVIPDVPGLHYKVASWDQYHCFYNGWLSPEIKAMQHDFQGMTAKAQELCESDALVKRGSQGNITMSDMLQRWLHALPGLPGSRPSYEDSLFLAAWACAMGSAACDMAYCAYTYCKTDDGFGTYEECHGWDPVKGMPVDS
ncbi:unnamed protein product [Symbiodinium natans]|uniref:Uncharacterized protein n=1 Tax=Symbiodinium natans TaxID=878477 RepID=A0A812T522_9DINO|nr:unnamed protein product [Symbiodinium natans]